MQDYRIGRRGELPVAAAVVEGAVLRLRILQVECDITVRLMRDQGGGGRWDKSALPVAAAVVEGAALRLQIPRMERDLSEGEGRMRRRHATHLGLILDRGGCEWCEESTLPVATAVVELRLRISRTEHDVRKGEGRTRRRYAPGVGAALGGWQAVRRIRPASRHRRARGCPAGHRARWVPVVGPEQMNHVFRRAKGRWSHRSRMCR